MRAEIQVLHGPPKTSSLASRLTTIRHGGPSGLRTRMRSDERGPKSVGFHVTGGRMDRVTGLEGGCYRIFGLGVPQPHSSICLIPLWLCPVNRPARLRRGRKAGTRATPPPKKTGGSCDPDSGTELHTAIRPHGVALVLIYPCGKARNSPPGAALKARRRTYEMAQSGPFFEGALAPARWPDELEKPDPGFRRRGLAGASRFGALGLGRGGGCFKV